MGIATLSQMDRYHITGTQNYPNVVSVFIKDASGKVAIKDDSVTNDLDHNPCNFLVAIDKIRVASHLIFQGLRNGTVSDFEFRLAVKCFGRASIQLIPVVGNLILFVYDRIRIRCFVHPQLKASLEDRSIVGIALDGKPVFTVPVECVNVRFVSDPFGILYYSWLKGHSKQLGHLLKHEPARTNFECAKAFEGMFRA